MIDHLAKLKSISDQTRLRILYLLLHSKEKLCVCELVDTLNLPTYTISKHLKELKNANLVEETKSGKFVMYYLTDPDSQFHSTLLDLLTAIPKENFINDIQHLKERLSLREEGVCVVGMAQD
jgi:ArsR family transcriptional regulator